MLKVMMNEPLPKNRDHFLNYLRLFFGNIYDLKSFKHEFSDMFDGGGLNRIADLLYIERVGITH